MNKKAMIIDVNPVCGGGTVKYRLLLAAAVAVSSVFALDFAKSFLHYDKERDIDYLFQQIDAITALQLQEVAQECFDPQRLTTLMIQ